MIGIQVRKNLGIGDAIQFTSVPENYFKHFGDRVVDTEGHWIFDHNPYVIRDQKCDRVVDLWDGLCLDVPKEINGRTVLLSNAEAHSKRFAFAISLNRPRLYRFEEYPFEQREDIILHTRGRSHGQLPEHVVRHVVEKYHKNLVVLNPQEWNYSQPLSSKICKSVFQNTDIWRTVEFISKARMFIGVDSGPSWIAQCFPDVVTKKVRLFPAVSALKNWIPLEWCRLGSYWDDRSAMIYNSSEDDAGFTWSYKRI